MAALWRSPTVRSLLVYGIAGAGFAGANLILARVLSKSEYGLFTLVIALANLGFALAPLGAEDMVNRYRLDAGPRLLWRVMRTTIPIGILFTLIGTIGYQVSLPLALMLGISTAAGGAMMVAAGQFQSEQRFGRSLALIQSPNVMLLVAALVAMAAGWRRAWEPIAISSAGFVVVAALGWFRLFRERPTKAAGAATFPWREAFALAGVNAAGLLLIQLERLVLPYLLSYNDLATYGVLAATAGSLFRVLQMGVGYALIPRLRAAPTVRDRRRLIAQEVWLAGSIAALGAVAIGIMLPVVEHYVLRGKYHLSAALVLAAIVSGVAKLLNAFAKATVTALAEPSEVRSLNFLGWLSATVAIGAAVLGARWGLAGVIYGVGLGWLIRALSAFYVTARHLRPLPVTAATPIGEATPR